IFTTIDVPRATSTSLDDINARGQIVGSFTDAEGVDHGFLLAHGVFTTIDVPGAVGTFAHGINARGQIVGAFQDAAGAGHRFVLTRGVFTTFDVPGAIQTDAQAINARGQIVGDFSGNQGFHGFLLEDGVFTPFIEPINGNTTFPQGINAKGDILDRNGIF